MTEAIRSYCQRCEVCQRSKADTTKMQGLYQPLPVPSKPWEHVHIDFVTDLPDCDGHNTIMTVVDRFSKMTVLVALRDTGAEAVACSFFNKVASVYGLPTII